MDKKLKTSINESLHKNGYIHVPEVFTDEDLTDLKKATSYLINKWQNDNHQDFWNYIDKDKDKILYRIHNFENHYSNIRKVIENARFKNLVTRVFSKEAYPVVFALIIKMKNKGASVPWHRDIQDIPYGERFNFSIYLDDSSLENGCLEVVPGSHKDNNDYSQLKDSPKGSIEVPAKANDVVIHDVRLLHGSGYSKSEKMRRSVIIEYTSVKK